MTNDVLMTADALMAEAHDTLVLVERYVGICQAFIEADDRAGYLFTLRQLIVLVRTLKQRGDELRKLTAAS